MKKSFIFEVAFKAVMAFQIVVAQSLKVATINTWSGLDYHGVFTIGENESSEIRQKRLDVLTRELQTLQPDVIALQELNPVSCVSRLLADSLGYDVIYQRANGGIKIGGLGIPWNLNEGLAILARKQLHLELVDVWPLSTSFGTFGNSLSFHFSEQNIALVGKIQLEQTTIYVINTHLVANVRADSTTLGKMSQIAAAESRNITDELRTFIEDSGARLSQVMILTNYISSRLGDAHFILLGDFNAPASDPEILYLTDEKKFLDVMAALGLTDRFTWDPEHNTNILYSTRGSDTGGKKLSVAELLDAWHDGFPRRVDYVFLDSRMAKKEIRSSNICLERPEGGLFASDHYGVVAEIDYSQRNAAAEKPAGLSSVESAIEPLPILSYDTDVGFGFGAKAFFLNQAGMAESFDVVLFNSTKGERWYRLVFSVPDFELRQGKIYPVAFDLIVDYDKWISNSFFGIGSISLFTDREIYTREPLEVTTTFSRGFSKHSVGQAGLRFKTVRNFKFEPGSRLLNLSPNLNSGTASAISLLATFRHDTRDSYINPSRGLVLQGELEYAPRTSFTNVSFIKSAAWIQRYAVLFYPKTVLGVRAGVQTIFGDDIPVQFLVPIGGNQTLRGYRQDRFLDKTGAILNLELRFPIFWRLGGVLGYDAGKVWRSIGRFDFSRWAGNHIAGLRFYMNTFVVRLDIGFGNETTGFYLNFGHLF